MATEYGTVGLSGELDGEVVYHFCYQATASFSLSLNWEFTSTPTSPVVKVTYTPLGGSPTVNEQSSPGISGTLNTTLPAATFCYVKAEVSGTGGTLTTSLS